VLRFMLCHLLMEDTKDISWRRLTSSAISVYGSFVCWQDEKCQEEKLEEWRKGWTGMESKGWGVSSYFRRSSVFSGLSGCRPVYFHPARVRTLCSKVVPQAARGVLWERPKCSTVFSDEEKSISFLHAINFL